MSDDFRKPYSGSAKHLAADVQNARPLDWILATLIEWLGQFQERIHCELQDLENQISDHRYRVVEMQRSVIALRERAGRWGWIPFIGARIENDFEENRRAFIKANNHLKKMEGQARHLDRRWTKISQLVDSLIALAQRPYTVSDPMPRRTAEFVEEFEQFLLEVSKSGESPKEHDLLSLSADLSEILGDWALASIIRSDPSGVNDSERAADVMVSHRIYLPVAKELEERMDEMGAQIDSSIVGTGISRVWVRMDQTLDFADYVPHAYRLNRPEFDFPPDSAALPESAKKPYAFSDIIQEEQIKSWFHAIAHAQGGRCILCGGVGGLLWDRWRALSGSHERRPLVFRAMWDYMIPDRKRPEIGLQRLRAIYVICGDCEIAFDGESFIRKAESILLSSSQGEEDDSAQGDERQGSGSTRTGTGRLRFDPTVIKQLKRHIAKRRSFILRCTPETMSAQRRRQHEEFANLAGKVVEWIVDLRYLEASLRSSLQIGLHGNNFYADVFQGMLVHERWIHDNVPLIGGLPRVIVGANKRKRLFRPLSAKDIFDHYGLAVSGWLSVDDPLAMPTANVAVGAIGHAAETVIRSDDSSDVLVPRPFAR